MGYPVFVQHFAITHFFAHIHIIAIIRVQIEYVVIGMLIRNVSHISGSGIIAAEKNLVNRQLPEIVGMIGRTVVNDNRICIVFSNAFLKFSIHPHKFRMFGLIQYIQLDGIYILFWLQVFFMVERDKGETAIGCFPNPFVPAFGLKIPLIK